MLNINVFGSVVHEKKIVFIHLFLLLKGPKKSQFLYLNKYCSPNPTDASYQLWIKLAHWFLRRRCLHGKVDRRTTNVAPCHKLSWPSFRWANNKRGTSVALVVLWSWSLQYFEINNSWYKVNYSSTCVHRNRLKKTHIQCIYIYIKIYI